MARVVAILLGYDHLPGTTLTRYCASSVQTTRMAFHAIKAGEGDVFISAGVEMVSRYAKGNSDSHPDTRNPLFADARARTNDARRDRRRVARSPRRTVMLPDIYMAMGQTAENLAQSTRDLPPGARRVRRTQPESRRGSPGQRVLAARDRACDPG